MRQCLTMVAAAVAFAGMVVAAPGDSLAREPQILGLIASNGAVPLDCADGRCTVELSTFCMQEYAPVPAPGTPYALAPNSLAAVVVLASTADGRRVRLPVGEFAEVVAVRSNRAVRLEVSADRLAAMGLRDPMVEVGDLASLVPTTLLASDDPAVESEIALVTGPLRRVADRLVDRAGAATVAALITNRLVNAVPDDGFGDVPDRAGLWTSVLAAVGPTLSGDTEGVAMAEEAFGRCVEIPGGGFISFRQCLAARHDIFLSPQNRNYWHAVRSGT